MIDNKTSYSNIFKTTFLFGFVQIFNIIVKVGLNKTVALFLGAEGMGIIGIFNSVINMIKAGSSLGINQSAVRDISEANAKGDMVQFSRIISITNIVILFLSLLGIIVTILLSPLLSQWLFSNYSYTLSFIWLSIVIGLNILTDGQLAILKGMRQLRPLAKASIWGACAGLISAIPCYYLWGKAGIIPSLIITALVSLFFSNMYVRKIEYQSIKLKFREIIVGSKSMVNMGIALMMVTFIGSIFDMVVSAYISRYGSLSDVGFYNAGAAIITSYFGIIITAMSTDYYPRISAIHHDNKLLNIEMNRQSETGLIMMFPLVILFVFLSPIFIEILYSKEFQPTNNYTDYAMIGTVIIVVSNCMGMILLAKQSSKIFIKSVLLQRILCIVIYLFLYQNWGLKGLGIAYVCTGLIHIIFMIIILGCFFEIILSRRIFCLLLIVIVCTLFTVFTRTFDNVILRYTLGSILLLSSCFFSYFYMKKYMMIDIYMMMRNKYFKK